MINVDEIVALQRENVERWHENLSLSRNTKPWTFVEENSQYNFLLWHEEDKARVNDADLKIIVDAKRNIDRFNQLRNNSIEKIDEWILTLLKSHNDSELPMHSETPGMMIDRLSIMSLKRYHMYEETRRLNVAINHRDKCLSKAQVLDEQISDLADCLKKVVNLLSHEKLRFKVYRQFKMYNDPELNPELYNKS